MRLGALAIVILALASPARAQVDRYAVIVGNNRGDRDEGLLRYAEDDATKMAQVLRDLGGVPPENLVVIKGADADTVKRALITVNDRIRARVSTPSQAILLVYYSGHADAGALHLNGTAFEMDQLRQLVRGSAADVRLLIVDACRSGALTRVKGGTDVPPFAIELDQRLSGEGLVFLTSSSANEDAQESDELKGSFFTHYLTSALLGAADTNGDGRIVLDEAYRYAYDNTLRASSRTFAGVQHPTYHYDLRGQSQIVLTTLAPRGGERAFVELPPGRGYFLFQGGPDGPVVAEVGPRDRTRRLSLRAGRLFVRGRGADFLLEGTIELAPGETRMVADRGLKRIEYARLVRKGRGQLQAAHGVHAGYQMRTPLWDDASLCHGAFAGYAVELERVSVLPRIGFCHSEFANGDLRADADEVALQVTVAHAWDLQLVTAQLGLIGGASYLRQTFTVDGLAPARNSIAGNLGASLGVFYDLPRGFFVLVDGAAETYLFRQEDEDGAMSLASSFVVRATTSLGKRW